MRTRQEIFDMAWTGLKSQGFRRSMRPDGDTCAYRGKGGLKCAIGWCIPDGRHVPECVGVHNDKVRLPAGIRKRDRDFAADLQECHDQNVTPRAMEDALRNFAREHDLTIPGERG